MGLESLYCLDAGVAIGEVKSEQLPERVNTNTQTAPRRYI